MKNNLLKVKNELTNELGKLALQEKHLKEQLGQVDAILNFINIQEKQKEQAYQNNLKALEYEPELAILQSNLGVTFDLNEKKSEH